MYRANDEQQHSRLTALRRIRRRLRLLPLDTLESMAAELEELAAEGELEPLAAVLAVRDAVSARRTLGAVHACDNEAGGGRTPADWPEADELPTATAGSDRLRRARR